MHTPDGFLTSTMCIISALFSLLLIAFSVYKLNNTITRQIAVRMGLLAAIIFALQMLNFSVLHGTSGHFIGGALALFVLGPYAGFLVMAAVVAVQALVFGDGGVLALGANILLMGAVTVWTAHFFTKQITGLKGRFFASVMSVVAASLVASVLMGLSGAAAFIPIFVAMIGVHTLIGLGEALITVAASSVGSTPVQWRIPSVVAGFAIVFALAPFASEHPDGMERVAMNIGFYEGAIEVYTAPLSYELAGSVILASLVGSFLVFVSTFGVAQLLGLFTYQRRIGA